MTIYKFYCKQSALRELAFRDDVYNLYAITNSRKLAKEFKRTRDMKNCFKCVKFEHESEEEWETVKREYRNHVIIIYELSTFVKKDNAKVKNSKKAKINDCDDLIHKGIKLPVTLEEKLELEDATESFVGLFPNGLGNPMLFKRELMDALHTLRYMAFYRIVSSSVPVDDDVLAEIDRVYTGEEYDYPSLIVDELQVFADMFGELMRICE